MSDALTFLCGTAVGVLVVYLTKDKDMRITVERCIDGVADSFKALLGRMAPENGGEATERRAESVENAQEETAKTTKPAVGEGVETLAKAINCEDLVSEDKTEAGESPIR